MIIYFDTETTGLRPGQICQLSYILRDSFGFKTKNFFFSVDSVEYSAYLVHGFSVNKLKALSGGKTFADFAEEIAKDFSLADVIIAHNVDFDLSFLRAEFAKTNVSFTYKNAFCSMKTAVPVCKIMRSSGKGYKYPKLIEFATFCGITEGEALEKEKEWFGSVSHTHDARLDTALLALCVENVMVTSEEFKGLLRCI